MSNTIELLETIGRDASLRHASRESLSQALEGMEASEGLKLAVVSGDQSHLARELGTGSQKVNHNNTLPNGGCDPDDEDMENGPDRDGDGKDDPQAPVRQS